MLKRLDKNSKFSSFVLIYYSIVLIIYSLTSLYFPKYYDEILSGYFSIIISVVILAFSIINGNLKYSERIKATESTLNAIKVLKRELTDENLPDFGLVGIWKIRIEKQHAFCYIKNRGHNIIN